MSSIKGLDKMEIRKRNFQSKVFSRVPYYGPGNLPQGQPEYSYSATTTSVFYMGH